MHKKIIMQKYKNYKFKWHTPTIVHYIYRSIAKPIVLFLANKTSFSPNNVTYFRLFLSIISFYCFIQFDGIYLIVWIILFEFAEILDVVDWDLARLTNKTSKKWAIIEKLYDSMFFETYWIIWLIFSIWYYMQTNNIYFIYLFMLLLFISILTINVQALYNSTIKKQDITINKMKTKYYSLTKWSIKTRIINLMRIWAFRQNKLYYVGATLLIMFNIDRFVYVLLIFLLIQILTYSKYIILTFKNLKWKKH